MSKTVAILQSNYIPWKGYFDLIQLVDEFILYDDAQYTRRDWRNRNLIKTPAGLQWLTIPVQVKGKFSQAIREVIVSDPTWASQHWAAITHNYARAAHFKEYQGQFEELYLGCHEERLSQINYRFLTTICSLLGITTGLSWSMDYVLASSDKTLKLVELCQQAGADRYISGPAAKAYMDEAAFQEVGIEVQYMDYSGYPEYRQLFPPFEHHTSVIDLIFNEGPEASKYMKGFGCV